MKRRAVLLLAGFICAAAMPARADVVLSGTVEQGALVVGKTEPHATVTLDGEKLPVSAGGVFAIGFDRDSGRKATLVVKTPDGKTETRTLAVAPRAWDIQRIEHIAPALVTPPEEAMARIRKEVAEKAAARPRDTDETWFAGKFIWPARGVISGIFGSQRVYNGEPRSPHYGVDVAAPVGETIVAPADGIVRLAEPDMYFEGGLVFIDHGQGVISFLMHMSRVDVKPGQRVHRGEVIGAVGQTGRATGPHVHWGMVWRAAHVDPSLLVAGIGPKGAVPGMKVGG
jgi:murein DD-endopeptidase MepM/ murein hydrolase activator NlpD